MTRGKEPPPPTNQEIADMLVGLNRTASAWEASGDTTRAKKLGVDNYLKWFKEHGIEIYEDYVKGEWKRGTPPVHKPKTRAKKPRAQMR